MLSKVAIKNFLSIGEPSLTLDFTKLNILVGSNAAGKSNIIGAINLIAESKATDAMFSSSAREWLKFTKSEELFHGQDTSRTIELELGIDFSDSFVIRQNNSNISELYHKIFKEDIKRVLWKFKCRLNPRLAGQSIEINDKELVHVDEEVFETIGHTDVRRSMKLLNGRNISNPVTGGSSLWWPDPNNLLLLDGQDHNIKQLGNQIEDSYAISKISSDMAWHFWKNLGSKFYYISPFRGVIPPSVGTGGMPTYVGSKGEYLLEVLAKLQSTPDDKEKLNNIVKWAAKFYINDITAGWIGNNRLGVTYKDPYTKATLPLYRTSYGTAQLLPFIVQIFACNKGDTIVIEDPELSLHPQAQITLAELLAEAVRNDVQIILTTHSENLILALEKPLKDKRLKKDEIDIYHIARSEKYNSTVAEKLSIIEKGHVVGWISSFDKANKQLFSEYSLFNNKKKK